MLLEVYKLSTAENKLYTQSKDGNFQNTQTENLS